VGEVYTPPCRRERKIEVEAQMRAGVWS